MPVMPYPAAPQITTGPLPRGNSPGVTIIMGNSEIYPPHLLFDQTAYMPRSIDHVLQSRRTSFPVIQPIPTQKSDCHDYPWGPSPLIRGNMGRFYLTFLRVHSPATSPPVDRITILTPEPWRNITILPTRSGSSVTVADVQEEVVRWMREITASALSRGQRIALSEIGSVPMPDGNEVEVELWQWRGLKKHGLETDMWELYL